MEWNPWIYTDIFTVYGEVLFGGVTKQQASLKLMSTWQKTSLSTETQYRIITILEVILNYVIITAAQICLWFRQTFTVRLLQTDCKKNVYPK